METKFGDLRKAYMIEKEKNLPELTQWNIDADKTTQLRDKEM